MGAPHGLGIFGSSCTITAAWSLCWRLGFVETALAFAGGLAQQEKKHGQESAWFGLTLELKQTELGLVWIEADRRVDGLTGVLFLLAFVPRNPQHR